jgi:hypothetical protein
MLWPPPGCMEVAALPAMLLPLYDDADLDVLMLLL